MPTLAEKLVARACGRETVTPGELGICKIDLAMMHDSSGPRRIKPMLEKLQARVWDLDKVVLITDHYVPEIDAESRAILQTTRDWVREVGLKNFHDQEGICHVVLPEKGYVRPGMFAARRRHLLVNGNQRRHGFLLQSGDRHHAPPELRPARKSPPAPANAKAKFHATRGTHIVLRRRRGKPKNPASVTGISGPVLV